MKKIALNAAIFILLGFEAGTTEVEPKELEAKIKNLHGEKKAAELKLSARLQADETAKLEAVTSKVDKAIEDGKFNADKKDELVNLGIANESLLDSTLEMSKGKASLADQVKNKGAQKEVKSAEDFQKLSLEQQLEFKRSQPDEYKNLFTN